MIKEACKCISNVSRHHVVKLTVSFGKLVNTLVFDAVMVKNISGLHLHLTPVDEVTPVGFFLRENKNDGVNSIQEVNKLDDILG